MNFSIVRKDSEISRLKKEFVDEFKSNQPKDANMISYSMSGIPFPFLKLWQKIANSNHRKDFFNNYYNLKSENGYIKEFIPASEYYKFVFIAIFEKSESLRISLNNIYKLSNEILKLYNEKSVVNPKTNQMSIRFDDQVYSLKREISIFLFDSRSLLDSLSTMFHFLYGPKSKQFRSFSDFIKMCKRDPQKTKFKDDKLRDFIINNCNWFYLLKDVRDYITHFSSIDISFYEINKKRLKIYLFGRNFIDLENLVTSVMNGITKLIDFVNKHFSNSIT